MRPSARLVRAVAAERAELERQRARLAHEARELRAALARIEHGLAEIDAQRELLDRVAPPDDTSAAGEPRAEAAGASLLRGPAIREAAVAVLAARGGEALHYREWYELLVAGGHQVAGKDPVAVFLTQLSRSPVVRRRAEPGVYELDRGAAARLRARLDALHRDLRELSGDDLTALRARRAQLTSEIARAEKALDEAARLLALRTAA